LRHGICVEHLPGMAEHAAGSRRRLDSIRLGSLLQLLAAGSKISVKLG
jgi:hypothetical protein